MAARKWISPMLKGRGLKTINALPSRPSGKQTITKPGGQMAPRPPKPKAGTGARWRLPGYEVLSRIDLLRR